MSRVSDEISSLISQIQGGGPRRTTNQLIHNNGSLQVTVQSEAWRAAGFSRDDPPEVDQYWFPNEGLVVIDLEGGDA